MSRSVTYGSIEAQPRLSIARVTDRRGRHAFVELPYHLYAGHPHWVPPLRRDEHRRLERAHNPFLEHADLELFVARNRGAVVGRIAAIVDHLHNEKHREHLAWFGFLEADSAPTARALLETVEEWARTRGATAIRGPANPSLNESAGLLVDAFELDPYLLMPYNPPTYPGFVEQAGYAKVKDLFAWDFDVATASLERITRLADRVRRRHGIVIRPLNMRRFDDELAIVQDIYRNAWQDNWGFVPPTDNEIRQLAIDLKPVLDPEMVLFAEIHGKPVGCSVAVPDVNQVLKKMQGRLLPFGLFHFLRRKQIVNRGRVLLLGVVPEMRRIGLLPLMIAEIHRRGVARGYQRAELSWTLEDNEAINAGIQAAGGRHYKTYRLYEKSLG
jgi:GNAT superfamily N-acetyltransferase